MIKANVRSVGKFIKIIQEITLQPDKLLTILNENSSNAVDTVDLLNKAYFTRDESLRIKYISAVFLNNYNEDKNFENLIDAKKQLAEQHLYPKLKFYYRGHYSNKFLLLPSALRKNQEKENYFYKEMITRNPNDFAQSGHIERLVKMQHYELPTRLLDITSNPLVALYFACTNTGCKVCDDCKTGEVFMFAPFEKEILSFDSDKALILSCLPKFTIEEKIEILDICMDEIIKKNDKLVEGKNRIIDRLYHEIRREVPAFKAIINPFHILSSFFIQPLKNNNRIIKQDGAFIICGQYYDSSILEAKLNSLLVAKFSISNKAKILKELDSLGINEATLFPELDKVAHYLKERV